MRKSEPYRPKGNIAQKIFGYLEPLWLGNDGKVSLRLVMSIAFAINIMINTSRALTAIIVSRIGVSDVALVLGIEAGLIVGLLALKTYQNTVEVKAEAQSNPPPEPKGE